MNKFTVKGIKILVKNSALGTTYATFCKNCSLYPKKGNVHYCQEGIYKIFLTASGKARICKHRQDISIDFSKMNLNNSNEIKAGFEELLSHYFDSTFIDLPIVMNYETEKIMEREIKWKKTK